MNRLNKTESAVFLYCRFSVFLKDPFFQIILTFNILAYITGLVRIKSADNTFKPK